MSTRTRPLAFSALSLAALIALSACGGSGEDQDSTDSSSGSASQSASASAEPTSSASPSDSSASAAESSDPVSASADVSEPAADESADAAAGEAAAEQPAQEAPADEAPDSAAAADGSAAQAPAQESTDPSAGQQGTAAAPSAGQEGAAAQAAPAGVCDASSLAGSLQPVDAGMGSVHYQLVLTNTGSQPCVLSGYPGVSYADAAGQPVGIPASRAPEAGAAVTVAPGQSASAGLRETGAGSYGQVCNPHETSALVVYPPGSTEALSIAHSTQACGNPKIGQLQVKGFGA